MGRRPSDALNCRRFHSLIHLHDFTTTIPSPLSLRHPCVRFQPGNGLPTKRPPENGLPECTAEAELNSSVDETNFQLLGRDLLEEIKNSESEQVEVGERRRPKGKRLH